jgi:hypothetical protein
MISPLAARRIPACPSVLAGRRNLAAVYRIEIINLAILPLAITMLAGPQIMSAIRLPGGVVERTIVR